MCVFSLTESKALASLELVHTDIWGPIPTISKKGFHYYIHFINDFSRYIWIFPLKVKSKALSVLNLFMSWLKGHSLPN